MCISSWKLFWAKNTEFKMHVRHPEGFSKSCWWSAKHLYVATENLASNEQYRSSKKRGAQKEGKICTSQKVLLFDEVFSREFHFRMILYDI
jgi:hypothetical protein